MSLPKDIHGLNFVHVHNSVFIATNNEVLCCLFNICWMTNQMCRYLLWEEVSGHATEATSLQRNRVTIWKQTGFGKRMFADAFCLNKFLRWWNECIVKLVLDLIGIFFFLNNSCLQNHFTYFWYLSCCREILRVVLVWEMDKSTIFPNVIEMTSSKRIKV